MPTSPHGHHEFALDFRKIGFTRRVDVLNRPLRKFGTFHPYEHPENSRRFRPYACPGKSAGKEPMEHRGGFGSGRSALRVEIEVIAAQNCLGDGPLNGGQCFVRHRIRVREAREAVSGQHGSCRGTARTGRGSARTPRGRRPLRGFSRRKCRSAPPSRSRTAYHGVRPGAHAVVPCENCKEHAACEGVLGENLL